MMADTQDNDGAELTALLAAVRQRDQEAFQRLYALTVDRLYRVAQWILQQPEDAEEVLSDVYLKVWRQAEHYCEERGSVLTWLAVMCRSRALDILRKRRLEGRYRHDGEPEADALPTADSPAEILEQLQEGSRVREALSGLSEVQRQLVALAYFQGLTQQEIAAQTQLPLGTVKSHLRRAVQRIQKSSGLALAAAPAVRRAGRR